MACIHQDFMQIALEFAKPEAPEIAQRSSINRAYYATYHAAKCFHERLPIPGEPAPAGMGTHSALYYSLSHPRLSPQDPLSIRSRSIAYMSGEFKRRRVIADYFLSVPLSHLEALQAIETAKNILKRTDQ